MAYSVPLFRARSYQKPWRLARARGYKNFIKLWHRRAGKDRDCLAFTLEESMKRVGVYFHVFPSLNQGRRDLWDNIIQESVNGREVSSPMRSIFHKDLIESVDESDMQVTFKWGSIYQVMGADSDEAVDRLRGPNPIGINWSEYAHGSKMHKAVEVLEPVLGQNGGWQCFAYTPNGRNHGLKLWEAALDNPDNWFTQKLTIDDTRMDAEGEGTPEQPWGSPVISQAYIEELRRRGRREEWIQQEYYCSFTGFEHGTIYGNEMMRARNDGRITRLPYVANAPVGVCLDLGQSDAMAVWFYQKFGQRINWIDYWEESQKSMSDVVKMLRERPYIYGRVIVPWDGRGAADYLFEMGFKNVQVAERTKSVQSSIETVRRQFYGFYFDSLRCARGIECLTNYSRAWDEDKEAFKEKPIHSQWSHGADALRCGIEGGLEPMDFPGGGVQEMVKVVSNFDPRLVGLDPRIVRIMG